MLADEMMLAAAGEHEERLNRDVLILTNRRLDPLAIFLAI